MPFDLASALKVIAEVSKSPEVRGALYLAADELKRLYAIDVAVGDCVMAAAGEKLAAWVKVKELCRIQVSEKE